LRDAGGFDDWGTTLAVRKTGRLLFVCINPSKGLSVGVINGYEVVMMTAPAIFAEF
jgi:hypothetical protein